MRASTNNGLETTHLPHMAWITSFILLMTFASLLGCLALIAAL